MAMKWQTSWQEKAVRSIEVRMSKTKYLIGNINVKLAL